VEVVGRLARVAEAAGYAEEALRALEEAGGEGREGAWLRSATLGDPAGAARVLSALLERGGDAAAASGALDGGFGGGQRDARAEARSPADGCARCILC
jgi:hypothetical protein